MAKPQLSAGCLHIHQHYVVPKVSTVFPTPSEPDTWYVHRNICSILGELGLRAVSLLWKGPWCCRPQKPAPGPEALDPQLQLYPSKGLNLEERHDLIGQKASRETGNAFSFSRVEHCLPSLKIFMNDNRYSLQTLLYLHLTWTYRDESHLKQFVL